LGEATILETELDQIYDAVHTKKDIVAMCNCTKAIFAAWTCRQENGSSLVYPAVDDV